MKKQYLLFLLLFLVIPNMVSAKCSNERIAELAKIAENINIDYTYVIGNSGAIFSVKINNMNDNLYISNSMYDKKYYGNGEVQDSYTYLSGTSLIYTIYSNDKNCKGEAITSKYLTLPYYNNFSILDECAQNPDFIYCEQWRDTSLLTMEDFETALEEYKNGNKEGIEKKSETKTWLDIYKNYIIAASLIVLIATIAIIIGVRKRKKSIL